MQKTATTSDCTSVFLVLIAFHGSYLPPELRIVLGYFQLGGQLLMHLFQTVWSFTGFISGQMPDFMYEAKICCL